MSTLTWGQSPYTTSDFLSAQSGTVRQFNLFKPSRIAQKPKMHAYIRIETQYVRVAFQGWKGKYMTGVMTLREFLSVLRSNSKSAEVLDIIFDLFLPVPQPHGFDQRKVDKTFDQAMDIITWDR